MTLYYQDNHITILNGHVLTELRGLPSESIQCVCTSPPYWGLRDYGLEPQIWDDPGGCEHEWVATEAPGGNGSGTSFHRNKEHAARIRGGLQPGFCLHCGAWRGSLGLEPVPDCGRPFMELKPDLTEKEREYVMDELKKAGLI